ncbi:hypothetical protein PC129_g18744 [Phytophthora cactorum]|uniref:Tc1-like transposase DDE domain-containing protein n=1 Tax=Phytophthora cactorum TaxID=29920 RepID=A0A8T1HE08_9STRA|nr:hypothetical protein PC119_g6868 [Phytophthora cactorum]KAG3210258.1 hypothetical protein PC129_g18744 [Phytophthora cactorum]
MEADDYHGNFNAAKFEKWFLNLCNVLKEKYGGCNIHMDGASYHKRQINKAPTMKSNRAEIMNWLAKHEDKYAAVAKARQDEEAKSLANTYVADDCSADSAQN